MNDQMRFYMHCQMHLEGHTFDPLEGDFPPRKVYGKRTLRAALRRVDSWRADIWGDPENNQPGIGLHIAGKTLAGEFMQALARIPIDKAPR